VYIYSGVSAACGAELVTAIKGNVGVDVDITH
jgi:hypothetical protein